MKVRARLLLLLSCLAFAAAGHAQAPAAGPAAPKIAVMSLVGDQLGIVVPRDQAGTNIASNAVDLVKLPGPALDHEVMALAQAELRKMTPKPDIATLQVPTAGSALDPTLALVDGKVAPGNPLMAALKQEGFTHLLAVTKLRSRNVVALANSQQVGKGQLEGLGFYLDFGIHTRLVGTTAASSQGLIAPYAYVRLAWVDVAAMQVLGTKVITANSMHTPAAHPSATLNPWDVMTPAQKMEAIRSLLEATVPPAVQALTGVK